MNRRRLTAPSWRQAAPGALHRLPDMHCGTGRNLACWSLASHPRSHSETGSRGRHLKRRSGCGSHVEGDPLHALHHDRRAFWHEPFRPRRPALPIEQHLPHRVERLDHLRLAPRQRIRPHPLAVARQPQAPGDLDPLDRRAQQHHDHAPGRREHEEGEQQGDDQRHGVSVAYAGHDYTRVRVIDRLTHQIDQSYAEAERELADPGVAGDQRRLREVGRRYKRLGETKALADRWRAARQAATDAREMLASGESDGEMREFLEAELAQNDELAAELEDELRLAMVERDPNDDRNVIVEIRAGAGGDEAALFAGDVYRMLTTYAQSRG